MRVRLASWETLLRNRHMFMWRELPRRRQSSLQRFWGPRDEFVWIPIRPMGETTAALDCFGLVLDSAGDACGCADGCRRWRDSGVNLCRDCATKFLVESAQGVAVGAVQGTKKLNPADQAKLATWGELLLNRDLLARWPLPWWRCFGSLRLEQLEVRDPSWWHFVYQERYEYVWAGDGVVDIATRHSNCFGLVVDKRHRPYACDCRRGEHFLCPDCAVQLLFESARRAVHGAPAGSVTPASLE